MRGVRPSVAGRCVIIRIRSDSRGPANAGASYDANGVQKYCARRKGMEIPVIMFQAAIHPGECDGKDAGFIALREIIARRLCPESA